MSVELTLIFRIDPNLELVVPKLLLPANRWNDDEEALLGSEPSSRRWSNEPVNDVRRDDFSSGSSTSAILRAGVLIDE